ncbi:hypothetical protein FEM48_Zijuj11G0137600 [Ziziphus jujuba var. spinosa]|uniref:DUF4220 domain-containing protein n=1 Tax=Ziziphus jujuba var. spinosa TaxID=714518 RepID=A0A978UJA2_ZIZJJ|nr:hypothetical protein FEM48_Zijuj11G0137600 [Ziziphus jujuba var. spinosa]
MAYLSTDWITTVTIGLITKVLTNPFHPHGNEGLYAFWASFLLLHLGGPDTITSFALEDNEFWIKHLFGLILQVIGVGYCFFLPLPNNNLWIPTVLVFIVGTVKYVERTMALYLSTFDHFGALVHDFGELDGEADKDEFGVFEMSLTYALLIRAIGVDAIYGIQHLFSDWFMVSNNGVIKRWTKYLSEYVLKRRWCEPVCQYNMIDYCPEDDIGDLKCFIFGKLHREKFTMTFRYVISADDPIRQRPNREAIHKKEKAIRRFSKLISNYMFYLLVMKPELLVPLVGINWQMTLEDAFMEAKRCMKKYQISDHVKACNPLSDYNHDHVEETDRRRSKSVLSKACLYVKDLKLERHWKDLNTE